MATPDPLPFATYVDAVRREAAALRAAAASGPLDAPVPSCPGWSVTDLVEHVAQVYQHKVRCMVDRRVPEDWPPAVDESVSTLERFDAALADLVEELTTRDPDQPAAGWWAFDRSVGFWARRMAQESVIHRLDAELARGEGGPVDADLALDGVDELLVRFLGGDWSDDPRPEASGSVVEVRSRGRRWRVVIEPSAIVTVPDPQYDAPSDAVVEGEPEPLLRWLWHRGGSATTSGDEAVLDGFHARLVMATQ